MFLICGIKYIYVKYRQFGNDMVWTVTVVALRAYTFIVCIIWKFKLHEKKLVS